MGAGKVGPMCCGAQEPCCDKKSDRRAGAEIQSTVPPSDFSGLALADGFIPKADMPVNEKGGQAVPAQDAEAINPEGAKQIDTEDEENKEEIYEDGSTFSGQLVCGRRHGRGIWMSPTEQYTGQWKDDQRDGHGKQTWSDGRQYDGQFSDGKFDGHGRMEWHTPNGLMVYEGQYVNDLKHGIGKYTWPDNRVYEGQWVQGHRSGHASYTNLNGEEKCGIWKDDKILSWVEKSVMEK